MRTFLFLVLLGVGGCVLGVAYDLLIKETLHGGEVCTKVQ